MAFCRCNIRRRLPGAIFEIRARFVFEQERGDIMRAIFCSKHQGCPTICSPQIWIGPGVEQALDNSMAIAGHTLPSTTCCHKRVADIWIGTSIEKNFHCFFAAYPLNFILLL
jgi:hypothetical protein